MRLGKTIDAYAKLIEQAWQTTWNHKEWWIIAAFAGLANTGGVFSSVFNTFWRLRPADMITAETILDTFPSIGWFFTYTSNLIALENGQRLLSIALFILVLLLTLLIVTTCQHLLLSAVKRDTTKHNNSPSKTFAKT